MEDRETKICLRCGEEKDLSEFPLDRTKKDGHRSSCRNCRNERNSLVRRGVREARLCKYPLPDISTVKLGDYAELLVLTKYIREGADVALPHGSQPGWDLLVNEDNKWKRVQVKSVWQYSPGRFQICFGKRGGRDVKHDFDTLVGVDPRTSAMWRVPESYQGRNSITMHDEWRWG